MPEQEITFETRLHFDFIDRLKILFGGIPQIKTRVFLPNEVAHFNSATEIKFVSKTKFVFEKDKPDYGYTHDPVPEFTERKNNETH